MNWNGLAWMEAGALVMLIYAFVLVWWVTRPKKSTEGK